MTISDNIGLEGYQTQQYIDRDVCLNQQLLTPHEAAGYSPLTLAFLGDAVYEQLVRERLVREANRPVGQLHKMAVEKVCASSQSRGWDQLMAALDDEEIAVLKRGRNASGHGVPKSASLIEYRRATGIECLYGYLQLTGRYERMRELFELTWNTGADPPEGICEKNE